MVCRGNFRSFCFSTSPKANAFFVGLFCVFSVSKKNHMYNWTSQFIVVVVDVWQRFCVMTAIHFASLLFIWMMETYATEFCFYNFAKFPYLFCVCLVSLMLTLRFLLGLIDSRRCQIIWSQMQCALAMWSTNQTGNGNDQH